MFKAFSMAVAGTDRYHFKIRQAKCDHIVNEMSESLTPHIPPVYGGSTYKYVEGEEMRGKFTWGTDIDVTNICLRALVYYPTQG